MKITIGRHRVESDGMCITLFEDKVRKKGNNVGREYIETIGYYPNMRQALNRLLEEKIADSDAKDIAMLQDDIKKYKAEILKSLGGKV